MIKVTELTFNTTSTTAMKPTSSKNLTHSFEKIDDGAVFDVSIATDAKGAEWATRRVYAPPLSPPKQLKVWPEKNGTYVVYWKEEEDKK